MNPPPCQKFLYSFIKYNFSKKYYELGLNKTIINIFLKYTNKLTEEEIERAIGVIVSADTKVGMDRFDGKRVRQKKVSERIRNPEELIRKILNQEAPIFRAETKKQKEEETEPSQSL